VGPHVSAIAHDLARHGLIPRGGLAFEPGEAVPSGPSGAPARAALLVGHGGPTIWPHFEVWRSRQSKDILNPLDTWSREVISQVAERFGARAVSPSDKPYLPFQQWAMRAEGLKPSPLGILMHLEYGLWHAYRGALLFEDDSIAGELRAMNQAAASPIHLCDLCDGKPCLKSCPVGAYSSEGFAYEACLGHVRATAGETCMSGGCLDRNACPYGTEFRYEPEQQAFHMAAFAR